MEFIVPVLASLALLCFAGFVLLRLWRGRGSGVSIRMQVFLAMAIVSGVFAALLGLIAVERLESRSAHLAEEVAAEDAALVANLLCASLGDPGQTLQTLGARLDLSSLPGLRHGTLHIAVRDLSGRLVYGTESARPGAHARAPIFQKQQGQRRLVGTVEVTRSSLAVPQILKEVASRAAVLSLSLVIGTAIAAALVGRLIAVPIERLTQAASAIAHGERQAVLPRPLGREVRTLTAAVESMRRELEGRHLAERLAMDLSHQLKNPVAAIRASAEVLADGALEEPETARRFVGRISEAAGRLLGLVNNLLALTRLQARGVEPELLDVADLARQSADAHAAQAQRRRAHIEVQAAPGATVRGDGPWLRRAIDNLIDNALEFAPAGGDEGQEPAVRVRVRTADQQVFIEVENQGPGIAEEVRDKLFERFATTRRDTGGTGLGLAIVAAVAEQHGGSAQVLRAGPPRTCFQITLPRAATTLHQIFS